MTPDRAAALQQSVGIAPGTFAERVAATGPDARAVYGALLPVFAATGSPPGPDALAARTGLAPDRVRAALAGLAVADLIALHPDGQIAGAFPLSATPTRHRVHADGWPVLHAMCAVDALGIPAMLGTTAVITSTDPATGQPIKIQVTDDGHLDVTPPGTVVLLARFGDGSLATACCPLIDFHADAAAAEQALHAAGVQGALLTVHEARDLGESLFAALPALDPASPPA